MQILGSGMSNKMWDILVEHAKTCVLSGKLYVYYPEDARNVGVVFNNIYEFSGLIADGQFLLSDSLSDSQKVILSCSAESSFSSLFPLQSFVGITRWFPYCTSPLSNHAI